MSSMMVERTAYHAVGGMDPTYVYSHDYELWLKLSARFPGAVIPEPLVAYWTHPGALSRRFEGRHLDDLRLMRRIERGELRPEPEVRQAGAVRAAAKAFDLGVHFLRTKRPAEGRAMLRHALRAGPWKRRVLAGAGAVLPDSLVPAVMRMSWLKGTVSAARAVSGPIVHEESEPIVQEEPAPAVHEESAP